MNTSYRDVRFWRETMELVWVLSERNSRLSEEELCGLTGQMRLAAVSILGKIGEGHLYDKDRNTLSGPSSERATPRRLGGNYLLNAPIQSTKARRT